MKHPISPDTSGLYEKIWNFVREQLSVRYPFFRRLHYPFQFRCQAGCCPLLIIKPAQQCASVKIAFN